MFKSLSIWLPTYLRDYTRRKALRFNRKQHLVISVCDHFEPFHGHDRTTAVDRIEKWCERLPMNIRGLHDTHGNKYKHTFFYPIENYDPEILDLMQTLCVETGNETEVHLHHKNDTAGELEARLLEGRKLLSQHGFLGRDREGNPRYGFIHGNWALDNSHPGGLNCGVSNELHILNKTGCYADFTMPSAPHPTQTQTINSIYYAEGAASPKSHDTGTPVRAGKPYTWTENTMLCVQGPLGLNWEWRKLGILPRLENADLTGHNPPTPARLHLWERLSINVTGREDCIFVKLHTHGAKGRNAKVFTGKPLKEFLSYAIDYAAFHGMELHYASAREMVNIIHAIEDGQEGSPQEFRNYRYSLPPLLQEAGH